jgi:hypothetical protein
MAHIRLAEELHHRMTLSRRDNVGQQKIRWWSTMVRGALFPLWEATRLPTRMSASHTRTATQAL